MEPKPTILILCDYYLPGYQAGGPIRSLAGMVSRLSVSFRMIVVTRDRDVGESAPYTFLADKSGLVQVGDASVLYLSPEQLTPRHIAKVMRTLPYDVLYINSVFSKWFSIVPLWLRKLALVPQRPVVVAPRGELGAAPQRLRAHRLKKLYLGLCSLAGTFRGVVWHASTEMEAAEITDTLAKRMEIKIARDLAATIDAEREPSKLKAIGKEEGTLSAVWMSRITPKKNLRYALEVLKDVRYPVRLDIFGPKEDTAYWQECEDIIRELPAMHGVHWVAVLQHNQVREALGNYHLFFFPTLNENFGHVILEALTAGCAVLTSDQTPWHHLEKEGAGWALPLAQPSAFRDVLEGCARMEAAEMELLRARAFALGHRTIEDPDAIQKTEIIFRYALQKTVSTD